MREVPATENPVRWRLLRCQIRFVQGGRSVRCTNEPDKRLPGHICLGFAGQENDVLQLLEALDEAGVAVSSGSACSANHAGAPSSILLAMGFDPQRAQGSLRVTLGRFSTESEVNRFLEILPRALAALAPAVSRAEPAWNTGLNVAQTGI